MAFNNFLQFGNLTFTDETNKHASAFVRIHAFRRNSRYAVMKLLHDFIGEAQFGMVFTYVEYPAVFCGVFPARKASGDHIHSVYALDVGTVDRARLQS